MESRPNAEQYAAEVTALFKSRKQGRRPGGPPDTITGPIYTNCPGEWFSCCAVAAETLGGEANKMVAACANGESYNGRKFFYSVPPPWKLDPRLDYLSDALRTLDGSGDVPDEAYDRGGLSHVRPRPAGRRHGPDLSPADLRGEKWRESLGANIRGRVGCGVGEIDPAKRSENARKQVERQAESNRKYAAARYRECKAEVLKLAEAAGHPPGIAKRLATWAASRSRKELPPISVLAR